MASNILVFVSSEMLIHLCTTCFSSFSMMKINGMRNDEVITVEAMQHNDIIRTILFHWSPVAYAESDILLRSSKAKSLMSLSPFYCM
jgi:hypothetical protein